MSVITSILGHEWTAEEVKEWVGMAQPERVEAGTQETREELDRLRQKEDENRANRVKQAQLLAAMNERHAFIANYGGKAVATDLQPVETDPDRMRITFVELGAIKARYSNRLVPGTEGKEVGTWWIKHPQRREYAGMWFLPGGPPIVPMHGKSYLNLWQGWAVEPARGEWPLMRQHISEVLAAGDPGADQYIMRWIAWAVQNPDKQAEVALVLRGKKGSGKGTLTKALQRVFGLHCVHVSDQEQMTGKHNMHLQDCVLLIADEAYWAGDKRAEGSLKRMITEATLHIEPKFVNAFSVLNRLHIVMTANEEWVVPASGDERRFAVFAVSEGRVGDAGYFKALNAEMEGGGVAAMLYDLLRVELGGWHPREGFVNEALRQQKAESLRGVDAFYEQILQDGVIPGAFPTQPDHVAISTLFAYARKSDPMVIGKMSEKAFGNKLKSFGVLPDRVSDARTRKFPPLAECRQGFEERFRGWRWDNEVKDWSAPESGFVRLAVG